MNGKHDSNCDCVECSAYKERELQSESMKGKHDSNCRCVECIAYVEREIQCDIDEWMPTITTVEPTVLYLICSLYASS
jgi:hypothetical protein